MTTYVAKATPVGLLWHVEVPEIDRSTQARRPTEIGVMAADLIEAMTDKQVAPTDIDITWNLPEDVAGHLHRSRRARAEEERAHAEAQEEQKAAAVALMRLGYTRRDTGVVLGLSHQRVQQLVKG